jgi:ribonuclease HII
MFQDRTVMEIKRYAESIDYDLNPEQLKALGDDPRQGVRQIAITAEKRKVARQAEEDRVRAMLLHEESLWDKGYSRILGMDEVGRGPLAGPVVVGGVIFRPGTALSGVNDSKLLSPARREELTSDIYRTALQAAVAMRDQNYIDEHGIVAAISACQEELVEKLLPDYLLMDAFVLKGCPLPQLALVQGDRKSLSIAAASIIAKVHRDRHMEGMAHVYPGYGFDAHKGYGCRQHYQALKALGPCALHRRSYLSFIDKDSGHERVQ